jgi:Putative MetA-pathway of phenol degradation
MSQLRFALCASVILLGPTPARAQFTDAHSYDNTPVGINQLEIGYAFVHGNAAIDPSLVIADANLSVNQAVVDYTRYFGLFGRVVWVEAAVPIANIAGSVSGGLNISGSAAGAGDSSYAVSMLLKGGPALSVAQFDDYQRTTTVGMSVSVTAPTGRYDGKRFSTSVPIGGRSNRRSRCRRPSDRTRNGSSMHTRTLISTRTTPRTTGGRSCGRSRWPPSKDTSAIR